MESELGQSSGGSEQGASRPGVLQAKEATAYDFRPIIVQGYTVHFSPEMRRDAGKVCWPTSEKAKLPNEVVVGQRDRAR